MIRIHRSDPGCNMLREKKEVIWNIVQQSFRSIKRGGKEYWEQRPRRRKLNEWRGIRVIKQNTSRWIRWKGKPHEMGNRVLCLIVSWIKRIGRRMRRSPHCVSLTEIKYWWIAFARFTYSFTDANQKTGSGHSLLMSIVCTSLSHETSRGDENSLEYAFTLRLWSHENGDFINKRLERDLYEIPYRIFEICFRVTEWHTVRVRTHLMDTIRESGFSSLMQRESVSLSDFPEVIGRVN